jgi:hypothetical protein
VTIDSFGLLQYFSQITGLLFSKGEIMKRIFCKFSVFLAGVMTLGVLAGHAQLVNQFEFKMTQPFTVANTSFAAGNYIIRPVKGSDQTLLEVIAQSGSPSVIVETNSVQSDQAGAHLIFNRYRNVLALSEVFPGNGRQGYQLEQGHPEKTAAKSETPTKQTVNGLAK